mgnify:CR=1 FL=1
MTMQRKTIRLTSVNKLGGNINDIKRLFTLGIVRNFPNMGKETDIQISEAYRNQIVKIKLNL